MRLGFETKGEFQAARLHSIIDSYFRGGNHNNDNSIEWEITSIIIGLSKAWDAAEEYSPKS